MRLVRLCLLKAWSVNSTSFGLSSTSRISTICSVIRASIKSKVKCRAFVYFSLGPDAPAVAVDDALHDGQADARAFVILGAVQPLEDAEEFVGILHIETHAVVFDKVDLFLDCGLRIWDWET